MTSQQKIKDGPITNKSMSHRSKTKSTRLYQRPKLTKNWRLKLAPHKNAQIIFSRTRKYDIKELDLIINGIKISKYDEPKFVGIRFDRRLNFNAQIECITPKSRKEAIGFPE